MPKRVKSLRIEGEYFDTLTDLDIFLNEENRLSIIYGKNGSGKSKKSLKG